MSTITREFTKEQLQQIIETDHVQCGEASSLARIALASLEAEPVCVIDQSNLDYLKSGSDADVWPASRKEMGDVLLYRSAPPAQVSVPDAIHSQGEKSASDDYYALVCNACRAAMLHGADPVTTAYKLPFEQWLSQQTGTIDVECGCVMTEVFFHWLRVAYEAGNSPVIPDGLRLALSNAGIAAPESDEMLAATCEKYIQALVTWVKERKPFRSAVIPDGWVACSEQMPEDEQEVIVQNKMGYRYVSYFDEHSGLFFDMRGGNQMNCIEHIFVTHWMPLPAAPQQEAKNV